MQDPSFLPFGDAALIVEFGREKDRALSARVLALDAAISEARAAGAMPGVIETAPTFRSLTVQFDPLATDGKAVEEAIRPLIGGAGASAPAARLWRFPACYEGVYAPDLSAIAEHAGLTPSDVVALHIGVEHHVYMIGFLPGCPYMGDLPAGIDFPRRADPRTTVPAGSVAIAVGLTVIYPVTSPGGWHLIGRTPVTLFDVATDPPALLSPGDAVVFDPVSADAYARIERAAAAGDWAPESTSRAVTRTGAVSGDGGGA
ncbi:MAG: 5-oxoprolinase subunit PxpB [Pseudomonadota bacterium]